MITRVKIWIIIIGFIIGTIYYKQMSASIPKESNCSFSANIYTDIFAFICGIVLLYYGLTENDYYRSEMMIVIGVAIITEHIWQLVHNKIKK
jgi:hypothetical protein